MIGGLELLLILGVVLGGLVAVTVGIVFVVRHLTRRDDD